MLGMNADQQILLTRKVMHHLQEWGLSAEQQIAVLNLPDDTKSRRLRAYHENTPFPDTAEVEYRVIRLLGIIEALRTSYPGNPLMASHWIKTPHKRFDNRTPLHIMLQDGGDGVTAVLAELDCTYAWDLCGSQTG
ncbi:MAG: hypothetical protein QG652_676 [Pseudomonadota bacterium]|nr:hypothetical protein [Pseudomonadota bacterium]